MPTAIGVVVGLLQPKKLASGKNAPAKMTVSHEGEEQEYKSWNHIDAELGQEVEVEYNTVKNGNYIDNNITGIKVISEGTGNKATTAPLDGREGSIERQVCLKVAGEIACQLASVGSMSEDDVESALERFYLAGVNLLTYGAAGASAVS